MPPQIPPNSTESLGVTLLKSRGFFPEARWYWIGVGALIGYVLLFNFLFTMALKYLNREYLHFTCPVLKVEHAVLMIELIAAFGKPQAILSEEALSERDANRNGNVIDLSTTGKSSSGKSQDSSA